MEENGKFVRFSLRQRAEHLLVMVLFTLLLVTGLPQKFFEAGWAEWMILAMGGIDLVRMIHRISGILLTGLTFAHLGTVGVMVVTGRTGLTIVPNRNDFKDAVEMLKYCLGLSEREPLFDRFDYRQKFEYWGMVFGLGIMIVTGFILYFPTWATVFLPGQIVPAAKVAHSYEAMLALLVLVTWHMYSAHFNPQVFPFDSSIFTGKITRERMLKEHPLEYYRPISVQGAGEEEEKEREMVSNHP